MNWIYNKNEITKLSDMPEGTIGFIYKITNGKTGEYYIGKKNVLSIRKRKFGKKEIALLTDKRLKTYEMITKESDWKSYRSSNKQVQKWFKDKENDQLELQILRFCSSTKSLTYYELQEQFSHDVLMDKKSLCDNILGKFFRKDLE
jgi:succinate dehydrogenase flavin-adding protein (antitoxin of CptAB toxin-antitoxin module)